MGLLQMGFMASLPLIASIVREVFAGWLSTGVYQSGKLSLTATRRCFWSSGLVMASSIGFAAFAESAVTAVSCCASRNAVPVAASQVWRSPRCRAAQHDIDRGRHPEQRLEHGRRGWADHNRRYSSPRPALSSTPCCFSAALIVIAIANYLFLLGKVERIEAPEAKPTGALAFAR